MTQSKLKPLQQELARIPVVGPHPDFDQLTAFAESKLPSREREQVLAHLASCADCRELLSTAAKAREIPVAESKPFLMPRPSRPPLRTWLPWVSIAATVLIAATAVIYYRNRDRFTETVVVEIQPEPRRSTKTQSPRAEPAFSTSEPPAAVLQDSSPAAARPHWRINSAGQPQRSLADSVWQAVLPDEKSKMRVISVFNADVWIGGENSALYHSTDNGVTWRQITLPQKNGLNHAITHIRFNTSQSGKVESADGTTWTTTDSGLTWN
jgi:Photosynthesis system II assembly factor YCF48/Putative zinc-finger